MGAAGEARGGRGRGSGQHEVGVPVRGGAEERRRAVLDGRDGRVADRRRAAGHVHADGVQGGAGGAQLVGEHHRGGDGHKEHDYVRGSAGYDCGVEDWGLGRWVSSLSAGS